MNAVATVEGGAVRRLDQTIAAAVGASRVFALAQTVAIARTLRPRVRHPKVLAAGVVGLAAQSVWAAQRGVRRGTVRDRSLAVSDALTQCGALLVEAASWGSRSIPADARWSETLGAVLASWSPFEDPAPAIVGSSLLGWLGTYAVSTGGPTADRRGTTGQRINEANGHVALTMVGRAFGNQLVGQAAELDAARADAVEQAERLAEARERDRQHRIIHDSALQILEAIAGGWELDDELLDRRLAYEINRLRRVLEETARDPRGLDELLAALVPEFAPLGLAVVLDTTGLGSTVPGPMAEALADATHEALMNTLKHAAIDRAEVRATSGSGETRIRIVDAGRGFDTERPRAGFGLSESIEGRLRDIGGTATVTSSPAAGTHIDLRVAR